MRAHNSSIKTYAAKNTSQKLVEEPKSAKGNDFSMAFDDGDADANSADERPGNDSV